MKIKQKYYKDKGGGFTPLEARNVNGSAVTQGNLPLTGFTLIELLIVIVIIAAMATLVVIVINPGEKLAQMRDNERETHLNTSLAAIEQKTLMARGEWDCTAGDIPEIPFPFLEGIIE